MARKWKTVFVIHAVMITMAAAGLAASAGEGETADPFSASVSVSYAGKYIWRGQNVNDNSVLQPNVSGSAYGFTGSIWANIDLTNDSQFAPGNAGEFSEVDYTLDYSGSFPGGSKVGYSLGVIHYLFPNTTAKATTEIYGALSFNVPLSPKITWYRDVNQIDGSYLLVSMGHSFDSLVKWHKDYSLGLAVAGSVAWAGPGYNRGYFGIDETRFNDLSVTVSAPISLKSFGITPAFNLSSMLDEDIGRATYKRNNYWFGISLSRSF